MQNIYRKKIASNLTGIALLVLSCFGVNAQQHSQASISIPLGSKTVVIPNPSGFEEAASQFEVIRTQMSATEDPANDMLAVHLPVEDCEKLRNGAFGAMNFYTKISVRKANRTRDETEADFAALVAAFRKNGANVLDVNSPRMKAAVERLDKILSDRINGESKVELSQPVSLGEFDTRPNIYSTLLSMNLAYQADGEVHVKPLLAGLSYVRVNQRLLYVYTYRLYTAKTDIEVLQDFTRNWVSKILSAN